VQSLGGQLELTENTQRVIRSVASWFMQGKPGLLLMGRCGTGKSIMLSSVALLVRYHTNAQVNMGVSGASEVCEWCRSDNEDAQLKFKQLKTFRYVGIDDLGTEPVTVKSWGTEVSPILDVLYHRYNERKVTAITTNDSLEVLQKKYGQRMYDRFCEVYDRVIFDFDSFRQRG
jgi:DNA replication protein DnaC